MENIPEEILERILSLLSPYDDMQSAAQVCMQWSRLIYGIRCQRWRRFYKQIVNAYPRVTTLSVANGKPTPSLTNWLTVERRSYDNYISNRKFHLANITSVIIACVIDKSDDISQRYRQRIRSNIVRSVDTARNRHKNSACYHKDSVYIFGGISMSNQTAFNDLHRFDLRHRCWSNSTIITKGTKPLPRGSASMIRYDDKLLLFGGYCPSTYHHAHNYASNRYQFYNDLFSYDPITSTWTEIRTADSKIPEERASHSAIVQGHCMIIFGGISKRTSFNDVWILDLTTHTWQQLEIDGVKPAPRGGHSQVIVDQERSVIIGGQKRTGESFEALTDIWLLNIKRRKWQQIKVINENWTAPDIWCHPAIKINNYAIIFSNLISTLASRLNTVNTFDFDVTLNSITNLHMFILDFSNLQSETLTFEVTWRQPVALPVTSNKAHCSVLCRSEIFLFSSSNDGTLYIIS